MRWIARSKILTKIYVNIYPFINRNLPKKMHKCYRKKKFRLRALNFVKTWSTERQVGHPETLSRPNRSKDYKTATKNTDKWISGRKSHLKNCAPTMSQPWVVTMTQVTYNFLIADCSPVASARWNSTGKCAAWYSFPQIISSKETLLKWIKTWNQHT